MRIFRLCRASHPAYDGEGARLFGGRWNSKGTWVLYMSENRALAVLEVLVHLSRTIPDKYLLGAADVPVDLEAVAVSEDELPVNWKTPIAQAQRATRQIGDEWVRGGRSVLLSVPSVILGERNFLLNPNHADFARLVFLDPVPFAFDMRLVEARRT